MYLLLRIYPILILSSLLIAFDIMPLQVLFLLALQLWFKYIIVKIRPKTEDSILLATMDIHRFKLVGLLKWRKHLYYYSEVIKYYKYNILVYYSLHIKNIKTYLGLCVCVKCMSSTSVNNSVGLRY